MNEDHQIEALTNTLTSNYDMPEEFAKGLAEFLYDEGYRLAVKGTWIPAGDFHDDFVDCSNCGQGYHREVAALIKFCNACGAEMVKAELLRSVNL